LTADPADLYAADVEAYRLRPELWEDYQPTDQDFVLGDYPNGFVRHKASGFIMARPPSESEPDMTTTQQNQMGPFVPPYLLHVKESYPSDIKLGERYRDEQTGFEGTATSIHFYQHACERVSLESYNKKLGLEELTFDAKRLIHIPSGQAVDSKTPGGPERGTGARKTPKR
jgi:hypothetical protein